MKIPRFYQNLDAYIKPSKVLVIFGPRRVGKTTLLNDFLSVCNLKYKIDSGDNIKVQQIMSSQDFNLIKEYVSGYELIAIDEAQKIPNVGMGLKIIVDQIPGIKVIATGSSSFEFSGQVGEPLTGRKNNMILYPIAQSELTSLFNNFELKENLNDFLVYGQYPEVITATDKTEKIKILEELVNSYLLKDILEIEQVKGSKVLLDLLRLVAFQVGSEVSFSELGAQIGIDSKTVARYLDLFEKSFVLYNLRGFSKNLRKEITKKSKYYFYDNGIRNAIILNFNNIEMRNDVGPLWENFIISERLKRNSYKNIYSNNYFWRTWDKKEIDFIEEREGKLLGYEFKWSEKSRKNSGKEWVKSYPEASFEVINKDNYFNFLL
ncbi:MAG: ATP-binding protein [Candidatus Staskawiczbacteria bacterium]|nr:ATP-binding protein [Candidatus Staskawiczbacteria bacterium]